jgi:hypothetical protein
MSVDCRKYLHGVLNTCNFLKNTPTVPMGKPVHVLVCMTRHVSIICIAVFTALVTCNFLYTLHSEHATARQRLLDDQWLLKRCGEPDFYIRLKQHTDLCEGVEANARRSILLHSFTAALRTAQLCGFDSCTNIAAAIVDTVIRGGIITFTISIVIFFTLPILLTIMYRRFVDNISENHLRTKYNMPYGLNTAMIHSRQEQAAIHSFNNPSFRTRLLDSSTAQPAHMYQMMPDDIT